jgi:uncharacterized repeat protein (TIGR02543 family)
MRKFFTWTKCSTQERLRDGNSKIFNTMWSLVLLLAVFMAGCKKDNYKGEIKGVCPVVVSTDPMNKAVDVILAKVISATFNTAMNPSTINSTTFTIMQGATIIAGTVAPTANNAVFTFTPTAALLPFTTYTGRITTSAKDTLGSAMVSNYVWTFTTIPQVTLSSNPVVGGTTTGAGTFAQGSSVTVTATPNTGYSFVNWTNNGVIASTSPSYQFTMAGNKTLVANFKLTPPIQFSVVLSSNPAAGGTTTGSGSYNAGTSVTITATPNAGYAFAYWTENGVAITPASPSYTFTIASKRTLVAHFNLIVVKLTVSLSSNPVAGGTTTGSGSFNPGTSVTVKATPSAGYSFINWTENGTIVSTSSPYIFALTANRTLVANFAPITFSLNVTAVNGTVVKNPNFAKYNSGATVQLTATPNSGYTFTSWSGDATGSVNPLTVTMNANKNITANFTAVGPPPLFSTFFGGFGGTAGMTNQGINTVVNNGGIGTTAVASAITGFHDGLTGDVYISISPANKPGGIDPGAGELGGLTLAPGVYKAAGGTFKISNGNLTLDAKGDPNATWIFQTAAGLTVGIAGPAGAKSVNLINGAQSKNVYWYVGSAATINAAGGGVMTGTIVATAGVTLSTAGNNVQTVLNGRAISLVASVTMVNTTINVPQ